ncbi:hypothetical protein UFOVP760_158 [uncultured Caudovirales phage]|uniref:Uncharacterized protein n=1 Tax=uncultured Caudovirales phage TaxID=2100421 RepID=A0A6J7X6X9_9CAUD|nr:hypothetical protein UFOVP760_158 [uncultured Caudovirales phage]
MNIPDSINELTVDSVSDPFAAKSYESTVSFSEIESRIRQITPPQYYKPLEEGLAFYKKDTAGINSINNLLHLYCEAMIKAIAESKISEDIKPEIVNTYKKNIISIIGNLTSLHTLTCTLNKGENIIDVLKFSYIILGYAIDIVKKSK